ncbi:MAG: nucleotide sugar dehydrogenase [Gemmatimonadetes bacterium]|nr:nucleotide sugar dehydrogenase [Gemmatimonadota bacterium]
MLTMTTNANVAAAKELLALIDAGNSVAGIVGLGYVGLPLAVETARAGYRTLGYDVLPHVVDGVNHGVSHILDVPSDVLALAVTAGRITATADPARLRECDTISVCVPAPLSKTKDPGLSYVMQATRTVAAALRPGQLIILESTTFPGTTRDVMLPILEETGLKAGEDFFLCFSPERVDPGNPVWNTRNTPKVLGGITPACIEVATAFYARIFDTVVPVENAEAAELVKVYENTFRMINIALVNELAQVCEKLGVDVWNVIEAAATKPFGFMKFSPGPGLGGHCIPLDPHYLAWKMKTLQYRTRMIEVASEINSEMPQYVARKASDALNNEGKALSGSRILVLGVSYKRDIDDLRESPAMDIIRLLQEKGADVAYHDPHCAVIRDDGHTEIHGLPLHSLPLTAAVLQSADLVVIVTAHSGVDYQFVADHAPLVLDTRGAMRNVAGRACIIGLSGAVEHPGERPQPKRTWAEVATSS